MQTTYDNIAAWFKDDSNRKKFYIFHGIIFLFYMLFFYVIAESGYSADDMFNSNALGLAYISGDSVWELTKRGCINWMKAGRFFPFSDYVYLMFYFIPSRVVYKLLIILSIYINSLLFAKCVEKISRSKAAGMFTMVFLPMCLQLTGEFDSAFYCFHMLVQFTFIWTLLSLLCVMKYIDKCREKDEEKKASSRYAYLILSGVFLFIALGTYEVAFVLVAFVGLAAWAYAGGFVKACKVLIPDFIAYGLACIINLVLRMNVSDVGYNGIAINLDPTVVFRTFMKQIYSTLPLSRFIYRSLYIEPPYSKSDLIGNLRWTDAVMVVLFIIAFLFLAKAMYKNITDVKNYIYMILGGISLMVFPALLIAITQKYQTILDWGMSHISSYVQSFGLVIICMSLYALIMKKLSKTVVRIVTVIVIVISIPVMLLQEMESRTSVFYKNQLTRYQVENIEKAGKTGVFDQIEPEDQAFGLSLHIYDLQDSKVFYSRYAKREINLVGGDYIYDMIKTWEPDHADKNDIYTVQSQADMLEGYVVVSHISDFKVNQADASYSFYADSVRLYTDYSTDFEVSYIEDGVKRTVLSSELEMEKQTNKNRKIYVINGNNLDVDSIQIIR